MKACNRCKKDKSTDAFDPSALHADGFKPRCRVCAEKQAEYNRKHYAQNAEHHRRRAQAWREANPEKQKAQAARVSKELKSARYKSWRERNLEYAKEKRRENHQKNRDAELARHKKWKLANKEQQAEYQRQRLIRFPEKNRFARSLRRAAEKQATPSWANKRAMLSIYKEAVRLTELTGIPHHVDHIIPLQSPWVCGLHCEANLQILPYYENQSKSNRVWPDMPDLMGCSPQELAA